MVISNSTVVIRTLTITGSMRTLCVYVESDVSKKLEGRKLGANSLQDEDRKGREGQLPG
jgi:hypothetical protein